MVCSIQYCSRNPQECGRASLSRRVPPNGYPGCARRDERRPVEVECHHGRAAGWRSPNDPRAIGGPGEVLLPVLQARVEKSTKLPGQRINGRGASTLMLVALGAREPEILVFSRTAERQRHNMIDFKSRADYFFGGPAIAAAMTGLVADPAAERRRNRSTHSPERNAATS